MTAVLEIGPVTVRRLDGPGAEPVDRGAATAALDGIDDPVVLVGDRIVAIGELWCDLLRSLTGPRCDRVTLIHPSWWPRRRVNVVIRAARSVCDRVAAVPRRDLLGERTAVVVETGVDARSDVIAVTTSSSTAVRPRCDIDGAVGVAVQWARDSPVFLDVPHDDAVGDAVRNAFEGSGIPTVDVPDVRPPASRRRHRLQWGVGLAAGVLISTLTWLGIPDTPLPESRWNSVLEGRVGVEVPAGWNVQRVTGGPGSRRVQVTSPTDSDIALHITQTYAPGGSLDDAAAMLQSAIADQVRGVFVDFQSHGRAAGRSAVTYREMRTGRVVEWSVLQSGATRISIGCQSAPGREEAVRPVCDQAVRTAREVL